MVTLWVIYKVIWIVNSNKVVICVAVYFTYFLFSVNGFAMPSFPQCQTDIHEYTVINSENKKAISVTGTGVESCRIETSGEGLRLFISNLWDYPNLYMGNYMKEVSVESNKSYQIIMFINENKK